MGLVSRPGNRRKSGVVLDFPRQPDVTPRITGAPAVVIPHAADAELRHGYRLADLTHLAHAAVHRDNWHQSQPLDERLSVVFGAMAEHLYASETPPTRRELIRAGWDALRRHVEDEWHTHGVARNTRTRTASVYDGGQTMVNFWRFWWAQARTVPSPEGRIVERVALWQVFARLRPSSQRILLAKAAHGDNDAAAAALGRSRSSFVTQLGQARNEFLVLWHEGETPSRIWQYDRARRSERAQREVMASFKQRERRRQRGT